MGRNWQARIDAIGISRGRVAREAGLCEKTVYNIMAGKETKNKTHRRRLKTLARIEGAIKSLERQAKRIPM